MDPRWDAVFLPWLCKQLGLTFVRSELVTDISVDKLGIDRLLYTKGNRAICVEHKARDMRPQDNDYEDLTVEYQYENYQIGWSEDLTKKTDILVFSKQYTDRMDVFAMKFNDYRKACIEKKEDWLCYYFKRLQPSRNHLGDVWWHQLCFVPIDVLKKAGVEIWSLSMPETFNAGTEIPDAPVEEPKPKRKSAKKSGECNCTRHLRVKHKCGKCGEWR